jgi:hypothetical protein
MCIPLLSIISRTGTAICQIVTLSLLVIIGQEVVPFRAYAKFLAPLLLSKRILDAVFCDVVGHCLDHLNCVNMSETEESQRARSDE